MFDKVMELSSRGDTEAEFKFECSECNWTSTERLEKYGNNAWNELLSRADDQHKQKQCVGDNPCRGFVKIRCAYITHEDKSLELEDGSALGFCADCFWAKLLVVKKGVKIDSLYKLLDQEMKFSHNKLGGHACNPSARELLIRLHQG